jgi:branched-chain amino acid transport system permease protein
MDKTLPNQSSPSPLTKILVDSIIMSLVGGIIGFLLIGFKTEARGINLELEWRLSQVLALVVFVFVGRLCLGLRQFNYRWPAILLAGVVSVYFVIGLLLREMDGFYDLPLPYIDNKLNWMTAAIYMGLVIYLAATYNLKKVAREKKIVLPTSSPKVYLSPIFRWMIAIAVLFILISLPFLSVIDRRYLNILTQVLLYVVLAWGLNVVVGLAGLLDLGYVAFYAVGAYSYALLSQYYGFSFWLCLPLAGILAGGFGVMLGFPVLRLRGDYLAIVTLGFGEIIRMILVNWYQFTGGPNGLNQIPKPSLLGYVFEEPNGQGNTVSEWLGLSYSSEHFYIFMYLLILVIAMLVLWFVKKLRRLPIGRAWEALREDEIACRALGLNPTNVKLAAFATGAMIAGVAGCFFAAYQGFISPESFTFMESVTILAIVVLGGMGNQLGIVLATVILIFMLEFRDLEQFRMLALGGLEVFIMIWRPRGLISRRYPTIFRRFASPPFSLNAR